MYARSPSPYRQALFAAAAAIGVDQATKLAAVVANGHQRGAVVPVHNPDFSLGIAAASFTVEVGLMAAGIAAATLYLLRQLRRGRVSGWIAGLLIGGAASNLVDRALTGAVHDFLATPWIVFNVADVAVLVGVAGTAYATLRTPKGGEHDVDHPFLDASVRSRDSSRDAAVG